MIGVGKEKGKEEVDEVTTAEEQLLPRGCKVHQPYVMALLALVMSLLAVCMWYSTQCSRRVVYTQSTESLQKEILGSTVDFLDELFHWNGYAAKSLAEMLERDLLGDCTGVESLAKIRAASWSLFKAIPFITSIGVTSTNGVTGIFSRGGFLMEDLEKGGVPVFLYVNDTGANPPHYVESVHAVTGETVDVEAKDYVLMEHIRRRWWYRSAVSVPVREMIWHLESSPQSGPYIQSGTRVSCDALKQTAVVHCSQTAKAVTDYLSNPLTIKGAEVFVINDAGDVVFSSDIHISGCNDPSDVCGALSFVRTQIDLGELVKQEIHRADAQVGGHRYYVDSWPRSFQGIDLAIVIAVPHRSLGKSFDIETWFAMVAISVLALGLSVLVGSLICQLSDRVAIEMRLRNELFQQLEKTRRAEASRDAKTAFLSHMSHELRTPMACIIGLLESLLGDLRFSEHESSVKQVHRCATALVTLLNSALDIAKVEAGKLELEQAEFDLEAELSALVDVFTVQCDTKGLYLSLQVSDNMPKLLWGDPARVIQIFTNLLGNSIKFTKTGRIIVRAYVDDSQCSQSAGASNEAGKSDRDDDVVVFFEVDDSGSGIDRANREKVFENFVQGDLSTPRLHGGTGLGLGIVKSLVHLMGGEIKIGDKVGNGTLFQLSLRFQARCVDTEREFDLLKCRQVVLGMPERDSRDIVAMWLEGRGLAVHQVRSWEDILIHMKALSLASYSKKVEDTPDNVDDDLSTGGIGTQPGWAGWARSSAFRRSKSDGIAEPRGEKPVFLVDVSLLPPFVDEAEYLRNLDSIGFPLRIVGNQSRGANLNFDAIIWVTSSKTPAPFKRVLKLVNRSIVTKRPLHPARLRDVFHRLGLRQHVYSVEGLSRVPSPLRIAKHMGDNYSSDSSLENGGGSGEVTPENSWRCGFMGPVREDSNEGENLFSNLGREDSVPTVESSFPPPAGFPGSLLRSFSSDVTKLPSKPVSRAPSKALQEMEILVAEDHPLLRRLATSMLRKLGARPHEALDGQEAVDMVVSRREKGQHSFHCILMDCQMPVMDGFDACKAIREFEEGKKQHTCIIALTANAMETDQKRCFDVGMDAFLSKPIQQENLIRMIQSSILSVSEEDSSNTSC